MGRGAHGVALAAGIERVPGLAPARRGGVQRRVWGGLALGLAGGEADSGRVLVEGQGAVAVLAGENGGGAAVTGLIGGLALNGDVRVAPARVVGFEKRAVHETLCNCKEKSRNRR